MTRSCETLGVCQDTAPPCASCPTGPVHATVAQLRAGKPMPCAFCLPQRAPVRRGFYPGDLATEGPFAKRGALARALGWPLRFARTLYHYLTGPLP